MKSRTCRPLPNSLSPEDNGPIGPGEAYGAGRSGDRISNCELESAPDGEVRVPTPEHRLFKLMALAGLMALLVFGSAVLAIAFDGPAESRDMYSASGAASKTGVMNAVDPGPSTQQFTNEFDEGVVNLNF